MYTVITSLNQKYWDEVANENSHYLDKNWIAGEDIFMYHEFTTLPKNKLSSRVQWIDLYQSCPEIVEFGEKWKDHPHANGSNGTNFRLNAIKFVHKTFAIWHRAKIQKTGYLIWLDCDALVYNKIDKTFIDNIFKNDTIVSYIGRPGKYSECGFLAFNLDHPETHIFLNRWETLYTSGEFIKLSETHDSWTFDVLRNEWQKPELFYNLNADALTKKHPFASSKIGMYIDHAKGADKKNKLEKLKKKIK